MLEIPEEIKQIYRSDNLSAETARKLKLRFYDDEVNVLYPYETLWPAEDLYPEEHEEGSLWLQIENDRIVTESFSLTESLSSSEDMEFGSCEAAMVEITVADVIEDVTGREFSLTIEVGGYEMALGIYTVESYVRQADRRKRKITAYDRMRKFDVDVAGWYNELVFPMTIKQFRDSLCDYVGVPQSQQTLLFDDLEISKTIEPEQISGREVLQAICQINGCFGHIDKTGQLVYVMLQQTGLYPAEDLWPEETLYPSEYGGDGKPVEDVEYYKSLQYEDYLVDGLSGLTIRQEEGDIGANVGTGDNPYIIEGNFLVYGKSAVELLNIAQALLPYISGRIYKPSKLECYAMPWLEVGDALRAQTSDDMVETFVMKRTMKGIQALMDTIEATGSQQREEVFGINKKIIQLEGKTAVVIVNVDEVSARVTNLKEETEAQFKVTTEQISAEVKAREEGDTSLSSRIDVTAEEISAEATRATNSEGVLSASISANATAITTKVSKGDVSSQISQEAGEVSIKSNRLTVESNCFKINGNASVNASGSFRTSSGDAIWGKDYAVTEMSAGEIEIGVGDLIGASLGGKITAQNYGYSRSDGNSYESTGLTLSTFLGPVCLGKNQLSLNRLDNWNFVLEVDPEQAEQYGMYSKQPNQFLGSVSFGAGICNGSAYYFDKDKNEDKGYMCPGIIGGTDPCALFTKGVAVQGRLLVQGEKDRLVDSENFGGILMNAWETTGAYFSDIGSGTIGSDGVCEIVCDDIFAETIDISHELYVSLTKTSLGEIDYVEKDGTFMIVHGSPGTTFDWIVTGKQKDYTFERMESGSIDEVIEEAPMPEKLDDEEALAAQYLDKERKKDTYDYDAFSYLSMYEEGLVEW